jgi:hypothetical protein
MALAAYFFVSISYPFGAVLNQISAEIRSKLKMNQFEALEEGNLKERVAALELIKTTKSLRDIKLRVGNFYSYERSTLGTFRGIARDFTVLVLLTVR